MPRRLVTSILALLLVGSLVAFVPTPPGWKVVAWNDLGMHCMDSDYTVFSILPPFNNVYAQLVDPTGQLIENPSGFTLTYEGTADPTGSINTSSTGKTNYWSYADVLYGASTVPNTGLAGNNMPGPGNPPQPMTFDPAAKAWVAIGIPIIPRDDNQHSRPYPLLRIVARDASGTVLASTTPVVPVSTEMDCRACHASGSGDAAKPTAGWVYASKADRDYRLNILRLHDEKHLGSPAYTSALAAKGFNPAGLFANVELDGRPILCAACHASNALPGTGLPGVSALTSAVHTLHGGVVDPTNGLTLDDIDNRSGCYRCHPGSQTRCLRGAMGAAVAPNGDLEMQCQSCHSNLSAVGDPARVGWLEQPNCQACHTGTATHNNGQIRYTDAYEPNGTLRVAVDQTFATDPNVPAPGFSLYRFSDGHGGLRCEACHGSTHAEFPATHPNDNLGVQALQGHTGMLVECNACHGIQPVTLTGGPHGMHPVGSAWVNDHHDLLGGTGVAPCQACHGLDFRGTVLSFAQADRLYSTEFGTKTFFNGSRVSCYACHNGPASESPSPNHAPVAQSATIDVTDQPVSASLAASDADGDTLEKRIVRQPDHGRVGLAGSLATYIPDPDFAGIETFTWAAWDGKVDSNLATVTVTRHANWSNYGAGYPGTLGVPDFVATAGPTVGQPLTLLLENSSGYTVPMLLFASTETAIFDTKAGGSLLTEPTIVVASGVPAGGLQVNWNVPNTPALIGVTLHVQAVQVDTGAAFGFAFSPGLTLTFGL